MNIRTLTCVAALLGFALFVGAPEAQAQISLGASAGLQTAGGSDFDGVDAGFGGEGLVRYTLDNGVGLSGGVSYASLGLDGLDEGMGFLSLFSEARYGFELASSITPFIGGRVAYRKWSMDLQEGGISVEADASGYSASGLAGIQLPVSPALDLELAVEGGYMSFGDMSAGDITADGTDTSGNTFGLRAGFEYAIGR